MASVIDIWNLALSHLGDTATVSSADPPDGSAQAQHCATFYPVARDGLLEMHQWGFATKRIQLAQLTNNWPEWLYCYAQPSDALNLISILPVDATDDYTETYIDTCYPNQTNYYSPTPTRPFCAETLDDNTQVIYTNEPNAVLRYTSSVSDTTQFSPLFTTALTWYLASMIAGPLLKGDEGQAAEQNCLKTMEYYLSKAKNSDTNQRTIRPTHNPSWIQGRS